MIQHRAPGRTSLFASLSLNRALIMRMAWREIVGRYRGSYLGLCWSFLNPLVLLATYTFVFTVVFEPRWEGAGEGRVTFALLAFLGLIVFSVFAECATRAPSLVLANSNYVKKVVFPLETLAIVSMLAALFHALVSIAAWFLAHLLFIGLPPVTALLLPVALLPLVLLVLGLGWFLAALGVYFRDVAQVVTLLTTALMFLSPVFYPLSAVPEDIRWLMLLNPLAAVIESVRDLLYWGALPGVAAWGMQLFASLAVAWLGFRVFQGSREGFADVL